MNATIDAWLTRFAAGAGTAYTWTLQVNPYEHGPEYCLRALLPHDEMMCPLSAQATQEAGYFFPVRLWREACWELDIDEIMHGRLIVLAADDDPKADPGIRQRLLRICRLEEPHHDLGR